MAHMENIRLSPDANYVPSRYVCPNACIRVRCQSTTLPFLMLESYKIRSNDTPSVA